MKLVNTSDNTHTVALVPRRAISGVVSLYIDSVVIIVNCSVIDGVLSFTFDYSFIENDLKSFYLKDDSGVLYRGVIYAATGEAQSYKLTQNLYEY